MHVDSMAHNIYIYIYDRFIYLFIYFDLFHHWRNYLIYFLVLSGSDPRNCLNSERCTPYPYHVFVHFVFFV